MFSPRAGTCPEEGEPRVKPDHLMLLRRARDLELAGRAVEATVAYRKFLAREPGHADAWADQAGQLLKLGQLEEAQKACATALALKPDHLAARTNLGAVLLRLEQLDEAELHLRRALSENPKQLDARLFLAECLLHKRDLVSAGRVLREGQGAAALAGSYSGLRPLYAELWAIYSLSLFEAGEVPGALEACHAALQLDPHNFTAKSNLGSIRMAQGHLDEAEGVFRSLLSDHPRSETPRLLLITCLGRKGDLEGSRLEMAPALRSDPKNLTVHKTVLSTLYNFGCWPEYTAEIDRFRRVDPTSAHSDWEQSEVDLLFGNMPQGWEKFEARLKVSAESKPKRTFVEPAWKGESFEGKALLLWAEQGLGDALMFIRYLPLVKALGGRVVLETWPALLDVAATCVGADVLIARGEALPPFDLQASLLSLPWIFRTELSTIPAEIPYLTVPDHVPLRAALVDCLAQAEAVTRIGLVWAGRPGHGRDFERSLPAEALAPLAALTGVAWFSFQLGKQDLPPLPNLVSLAPLIKNFSSTAYALSGMDLLITVDTSVAHLAGAMGIPTFLLLPFQPDFRWMLDRDDSPWYPAMRLYRQPAYGDWDSVLHQVVADLTQEP